MSAEKEKLLNGLEQALTALGVKILKGRYGGKGGLARYHDEWVLLLDRTLPLPAKLDILTDALNQLDWQQLELSEELREWLRTR